MKNVKMALIKGTTYRATITGEIVNKFGRPLHSTLNGTGTTTCIMVSKNTKLQTTTARLVWTAFKGEIPKGMIIEHKDGNIKNNALCNLKLTTRKARMSSPNVKARMHAKPRNRFGIKYDKLVN
jgi:hypothetical protein